MRYAAVSSLLSYSPLEEAFRINLHLAPLAICPGNQGGSNTTEIDHGRPYYAYDFVISNTPIVTSITTFPILGAYIIRPYYFPGVGLL